MIIIDLRSQEEYNESHLDGAINVPTPPPPLTPCDLKCLYSKLLRIVYNLSCGTRIYVYCKKGIRAGIAKKLLNDICFYNVTNLGGYK